MGVVMQSIPMGKDNLLTPVDDAINDCIKRAKLFIAPATVLSKRCSDIEFTPALNKLYSMMYHTMTMRDGIGLAAPQVGLPIRYIIVNTGEDVISMLNPIIISNSDDLVLGSEGCLSVPVYNFGVARHSSIDVEYTNSNNELIVESFCDDVARCIQHEIDHLNGITIIQSGNLNRHTRRAVISDLRKLKANK